MDNFGKWISVKERLPEIGKLFLGYWQEGNIWMVDTATRLPDEMNGRKYARTPWFHSEHTAFWFGEESLTHWMPLPEPPEDSDEG